VARRAPLSHAGSRSTGPRRNVLGQVQGGVAQGLGYALWESLRIDENGKTLEKSLQAYRRPLAIDTPRVETILTEHPTAEGPFGAKGAADPPRLLPPALVACAVSDATGRRINKIPVTPEDVLAAIIEREHEARKPNEQMADLIRSGSHHCQENRQHG
jgi:CO/xanthine dehydrogenase Mo-binding subunit